MLELFLEFVGGLVHVFFQVMEVESELCLNFAVRPSEPIDMRLFLFGIPIAEDLDLDLLEKKKKERGNRQT